MGQGFYNTATQVLFLTVFLVALDHFLKWRIALCEVCSAFCNHGIAFGVLLPKWFFVITWSNVMIFVMIYWYQRRSGAIRVQIPFVLIVAGGLSNVIDRMWHGCVIDYIPFFSFSIFNFADVLISLGVLLWVTHILREDK